MTDGVRVNIGFMNDWIEVSMHSEVCLKSLQLAVSVRYHLDPLAIHPCWCVLSVRTYPDGK